MGEARLPRSHRPTSRARRRGGQRRAHARSLKRRAAVVVAIGGTVLVAMACSLTDLSELDSGSLRQPPDGDKDPANGEPDASPGDPIPDAASDAPTLRVPDTTKRHRYVHADTATATDDQRTDMGVAGPVVITRSQEEPMFAEVTEVPSDSPTDGRCWTWELTVHRKTKDGERIDKEAFCVRDGALFSRKQECYVQKQSWPTIRWSTSTSCNSTEIYLASTPITVEDGGVDVSYPCEGRFERSAGPNGNGGGIIGTRTFDYKCTSTVSYLGPETVVHGGMSHQTHKVFRRRTMTNLNEKFDAWEDVELFLREVDGLPIRIRHRARMSIALDEVPFVDSTVFQEDGSDWIYEPVPINVDAGSPDDGGADAADAEGG